MFVFIVLTRLYIDIRTREWPTGAAIIVVTAALLYHAVSVEATRGADGGLEAPFDIAALHE